MIPRTPASGHGTPLWAYAYEIVPPQLEDRLEAIRSLLERERTNSGKPEGRWSGQMVVERQVTHILIVSDRPERDREANRRLESELHSLGAAFTVTAPMAIDGPEGASPDPSDPSDPSGPSDPSDP